MMKSKTNLFFDSWVMFKRCILISLRNPETLIMAIIIPIFMMLLFGGIFSNITDVGQFDYIDFIVPGIILLCVAQGSQFTAVNICTDMTKGIVDRFRSMPLSKSAVLIGHAAASIVRNIIATSVTIGVAFAIGFRPQGGLAEWLMIASILLLYIVAISWIAVLVGLISKTPESSTGFMFLIFILPYVSSGFAPTSTMHRSIQWFAQHQPMTPIVDSVRGLMLNVPPGQSLWIALAWCVGLTALTFVLAVQVYKRKMA